MVRNAFLKRAESALESIDAEVDRIAAKAEKASRDAKIQFDEELAVLRMKQDAVRARIRKVREAGGASWGTLKDGVYEATDDLKKAIERAVERLKKSA